MPEANEKVHVPRCGRHFCDRCGDCLVCYGDEDCYGDGSNNGPHAFEDPDDDRKAIDWREAFRKGIIVDDD